MLFDLRVVLAACLATVFFAAVAFGLMAGLRSPFKASPGYALNQAPLFVGPGLPRSWPLPLPEPSKPEITGTIANAPDPAPKPLKESKPAPQAGAKNQSITALIEEDDAEHAKAAKKTPPAKAAAKKRKLHQAKQAPKQPFKQTNPFSAFMNNNSKATTATP